MFTVSNISTLLVFININTFEYHTLVQSISSTTECGINLSGCARKCITCHNKKFLIISIRKENA